MDPDNAAVVQDRSYFQEQLGNANWTWWEGEDSSELGECRGVERKEGECGRANKIKIFYRKFSNN